MGITFGGFACLDPRELHRQYAEASPVARRAWMHPASWQGRANSFRTQRGEHCGRGWLLMTRRDADRVRRAWDDRGELAELVFDDGGGGRVELRHVVFVRARQVTAGVVGDGDAAYLVEVADLRWLVQNPYYGRYVHDEFGVRRGLWQFPPASGASGGDLRSGAFPLGNYDTRTYGWQDALDALWTGGAGVAATTTGPSDPASWTGLGIGDALGASPRLPHGNSTLTAAAGGGATALTVADATGFRPGDVVSVGAHLLVTDGTLTTDEDLVVVQSVGGNTLTVSPATGAAHPAGSPVRGPSGGPCNWRLLGVDAWAAYHRVLRHLSAAWCPDPADLTSSRLVRLGDADAALEAAYERHRGRLLWDAGPVESLRSRMANYLQVAFHRDDVYRGVEAPEWDKPSLYANGAYGYDFTINGPNEPHLVYGMTWFAGGQPPAVTSDNTSVGVALGNRPPHPHRGTVAFRWDDLPALWAHGAGPGPVNLTQLRSRRHERFADYLRAWGPSAKLAHRIYSGVVADEAFRPGSLVAGVAWYDTGDGFLTEVVQQPLPLRTNDAGEWEAAPGIAEHLEPPDFGRRSWPAFERTEQVVVVDRVIDHKFGLGHVHLQASDPAGQPVVANPGDPGAHVIPPHYPCFVECLHGYLNVTSRGIFKGKPHGHRLFLHSETGRSELWPVFLVEAPPPFDGSGGGGEWSQLMAQALRQTRDRNSAALDAPAGVVIGSYGWPSLVRLQLALLREHCGAVPVLVSNDRPEAHDDLARICAEYGAELDTNHERLGHTGGDVACAYKAVTWGRRKGLRVVAKLSQRCLVDVPGWLRDGARELLASGLPLACRKCVGREAFALRTEAYLIDLDAWGHADVRDGVLERLRPRRIGLPEHAENLLSRVLDDYLGGVYWPWRLLGRHRYKPSPGVVWHNSHRREDYEALAARYGVELDPDLHCGGWENDKAAGRYLR